jgi:hypothetical protein
LLTSPVMLPNNVQVFDVAQKGEAWKFLRGTKLTTPLQKALPADWIPYFTPFRFTASEIYCLTDRNPYKSRAEYLDQVLGRVPNTFQGNFHTRRGERLEPLVRDRYIREHETPVFEMGFVVPKWCPYIGVSPDGLTEEGCIEIKCPIRVWKPLLEEGVVKGEHYAQMQMVMAVCDRPWCDYIVYSEEEDQYFEKRIPRDTAYWEGELYPTIQQGIEEGRQYIIDQILESL